jgi:hypothetical protein
MPCRRFACLFAAAVVPCLAPPAWADGEPAEPPFKLTIGAYRVSGGGLPPGPGLDMNLRYTYGDGNVWVGWFRSPVLDFAQPRVGWDHTFTLGPVRLLPSLQAASGGFVGGSLAVETGDSWFIGAGLGRTNLRNYANLNFDPNDSYTVYGGYKWPDGTALSLSLIRDNRMNPDQQDVHLVYRVPLPDRQRPDRRSAGQAGHGGRPVHSPHGPHRHLRLAALVRSRGLRPKVNFTPQNMVRLSFGTRF